MNDEEEKKKKKESKYRWKAERERRIPICEIDMMRERDSLLEKRRVSVVFDQPNPYAILLPFFISGKRVGRMTGKKV